MAPGSARTEGRTGEAREGRRDRLAGDGAGRVWRGLSVDERRRGNILGGSGTGGGGLDAGSDTGWVGCGRSTLSSGPAAQSGTAGCSEPSITRPESDTRADSRQCAVTAAGARGGGGGERALEGRGGLLEAGERREAGWRADGGADRDARLRRRAMRRRSSPPLDATTWR